MSGYDQFFKKAKDSKMGGTPAKKAAPPPSNSKTKASRSQPQHSTEEYLRSALHVKKQKPTRRRGFPVGAGLVIVTAIAVAAGGFFFPEDAEKWINKIEISALSAGFAADTKEAKAESPAAKKPDGAKTAGTKENPAAASADGKPVAAAGECTQQKGFTEEELSHFNKLNERKLELDRREAELNLLEEELHKQKSEVESRISKLEQIRGEVANVLKDRVEMDQQRVTTLVEFYSNMKPKQAADVFATLNEDLAVEVLGRMKKKNAADILNLLEPTKARALSEKFTGYKRR